jgi:hypothetical protein
MIEAVVVKKVVNSFNITLNDKRPSPAYAAQIRITITDTKEELL